MRNKILTILLLLPLTLSAQNGSNSSYSRFGLGTLSEQSQTFNRGMGGVAYGLRQGARVNMLNPASYSCLDSLSFIFDVGMTLQYGRLTQNQDRKNTYNATLSNINAGFRLARNVGMSIGFVPFTNIGYTFARENSVGYSSVSAQNISSSATYMGQGGLHQLYLGVGWKPFADFSVGVNASYVWGDYNHSVTQVFSEYNSTNANYNSQCKLYTSDIKTYKLDFGVQYPIALPNHDRLVLGATYGVGHKINNNESYYYRFNTLGDTTTAVAKNGFSLPHTFGVGVAYQHLSKITVAADYTYEKWADCTMPLVYITDDNKIVYEAQSGAYHNRSRFAVGAEFVPDLLSRDYFSTVRYRIGFNYSTPYTKVSGPNGIQDGPAEMRLSVGLGLPLTTRRMSGRSVVNVSAEWMRRKPSAPGLITENYLMLNLGISFNEKWFAKWKIN
ncbi:MAG: hypothetical protein KBT12_00255 [Bacteroidales bacterium]|nr:hypothetical protein [Candidatus Physcousia equi]